ncbi:NAD(P)-binding Rossmann-fold superfamily protein [Artemisia annua]|uniref:NAD(P)-binding Rossmann-fold superfamily protein n=1 Tax=Artemisia annua TaxID=35608 RepID=A0A2U1N9H9_ARTAN|nr:NAD(P)-binding Rossmann-fold superfamily protein [Artemisia annua]
MTLGSCLVEQEVWDNITEKENKQTTFDVATDGTFESLDDGHFKRAKNMLGVSHSLVVNEPATDDVVTRSRLVDLSHMCPILGREKKGGRCLSATLLYVRLSDSLVVTGSKRYAAYRFRSMATPPVLHGQEVGGDLQPTTTSYSDIYMQFDALCANGKNPTEQAFQSGSTISPDLCISDRSVVRDILGFFSNKRPYITNLLFPILGFLLLVFQLSFHSCSLSVASESSLLASPLIPAVGGSSMVSTNMHSSPLSKTEKSLSHGAPEALDGVSVQDTEEAKKGMAVAGKVNTTPSEEKAVDAATKAKLLADHEEREIQRLYANIINHQVRICFYDAEMSQLDATHMMYSQVGHKPSPGRIYNIMDDDFSPITEVFSYAHKLISETWPSKIKKVASPATNKLFNVEGSLSLRGEKRVVNEHMKKELGVRFLHPSYRSWL